MANFAERRVVLYHSEFTRSSAGFGLGENEMKSFGSLRVCNAQILFFLFQVP